MLNFYVTKYIRHSKKIVRRRWSGIACPHCSVVLATSPS